MVYTTLARAVTLQSVKFTARVPSIKFRKGGMSASNPAAGSGAATQVKKQAGRGEQQAKSASSATIILEELPARFKRKPLTAEEIEYINNGGVP